MITELGLAVQFGLTIENLTSVFHPYLTLSEGIKLAAQKFDKDVTKLSCCGGSDELASDPRHHTPAGHGLERGTCLNVDA